ncbi:hypothetical protein QJS10_CPB15g00501 [Acorus calamus]|uniref:Uncharacterized protein n=1 Tax=Acorus calamus TaxID=4465 RepID=A0AAV9D4D6_ACOCL|nr:hypothetical protein QJS10_CPB15g00501 [Acorus calamus]
MDHGPEPSQEAKCLSEGTTVLLRKLMGAHGEIGDEVGKAHRGIIWRWSTHRDIGLLKHVFIALLRTCQPENKMLVKQAIDILMPALPQRLPPGDSRVPVWIRYTKKILVEEAENRRLAIELAGLVVAWERQRQNEMKVVPDMEGHGEAFNTSSVANNAKCPSDASAFPDDLSKRVKVEPGLQSLCVMSPGSASIPNIETPGSAGQPDEEYKPNAAMEEMIINFLIRHEKWAAEHYTRCNFLSSTSRSANKNKDEWVNQGKITVSMIDLLYDVVERVEIFRTPAKRMTPRVREIKLGMLNK